MVGLELLPAYHPCITNPNFYPAGKTETTNNFLFDLNNVFLFLIIS